MNHLRMKEKNTASDIDSNYRKSIIDFVKYYGFVSVLEIEGKIVAGVILYLIGNQYFLETISHDPEYNKLGYKTDTQTKKINKNYFRVTTFFKD